MGILWYFVLCSYCIIPANDFPNAHFDWHLLCRLSLVIALMQYDRSSCHADFIILDGKWRRWLIKYLPHNRHKRPKQVFILSPREVYLICRVGVYRALFFFVHSHCSCCRFGSCESLIDFYRFEMEYVFGGTACKYCTQYNFSQNMIEKSFWDPWSFYCCIPVNQWLKLRLQQACNEILRYVVYMPPIF